MSRPIFLLAAAASIVWFTATIAAAPHDETVEEYIQLQSENMRTGVDVSSPDLPVAATSEYSFSDVHHVSSESLHSEKSPPTVPVLIPAGGTQNETGDGPSATVEDDKKKIEGDWDRMSYTLYETFGDQYLTCLGLCLHTTLYFAVGLFFFFMEKFQVLPQYRIQPGWTSNKDYLDLTFHLLKMFFFGLLPAAYFGSPYLPMIGITANRPMPTAFEFFKQVLFCWLLEDFLQYFAHRLLHHRRIYKYIHKKHHDYKVPFALAASYAHPVEVLVLGMCTFAGPLLIRPHLAVMVAWMIVQQTDACLRHSGYHFPWDPTRFIPLYGGPKFHDAHHEVFDYNYASRFIILDFIFGTYRDPSDLIEAHRKRQLKLQKSS